MRKILRSIFQGLYFIPLIRPVVMFFVDGALSGEVTQEGRRAALIECVQVKGISKESRDSVREMIWQMRPK